jgi:hypothetical protein
VQPDSTYSPAKIVQRIKSITAKKIFESCPEVKKALWGGEFWTRGYYVGTAGKHGIETATEPIESKGGLLPAGKLAIKAGLHRIHSAAVKNAAVIVISLYSLMVEGKTDFESMKEKRGSLFFKEALNLPFVCMRKKR